MRCNVICALFGLLACGVQAQQSKPEVAKDIRVVAGPTVEGKAAMVSAAEPIISIKRTCGETRAKMSECSSVITRSEFESLVQFIQPHWSMAQRRQFASSYADALLLADQAHKFGLDSGPRFETLMKMQREFVLEYLLKQDLEEKAQQVPESDITAFYDSNRQSFDQVKVERLYVPLEQVPVGGLGPAESNQRQRDSAVFMKKIAEELRARAAQGENFSKLQEEAYKAAGYTAITDLPKSETEQRRVHEVPAAEVSILDLKQGDVSHVLDESNGHFVYKVVRRETLPLDAVREEITQRLRADRLKELQRQAQEAGTATLNESYFRVGDGTSHINDEP